MSIILPTMPLVVQRPAEFLPEHEKFANNGKWFLENALWYVLNYYNTYSVTDNTQNGIGNSVYGGGGAITSNGNPVSNSGSRNIVDEMISNYAYFYGTQDNRIFNAMTSGLNNNPLPTPFIKGQEVRELCNHMLGKITDMVKPIQDNISCDTISQSTLVKRKEIFDKIDLASKIGSVLNELGDGIKFNPAGEIDYASPSAIKEAKRRIKEEYANTATIIARNAYYKNNIKDHFKDAGADTLICNLAGIEFGQKNGEMTTTYIPGYQAIYDYSSYGEYGDHQRLGGSIMPVTLEEALHDYPDMPNQWRDEMEAVLYTGADGSKDFMNYYNQPFRNVLWWYNDQKWMSKATIYWLSECDSRYYTREYKGGIKKVTKIDDFKKYYDPSVGGGDIPAGTQMKKGHEINGDFKVWRVHKAVVLGAKYLVEYGYDEYQVRPFGRKSMPEIPIKFFCQGKMAGYVKSVVSRLKPKQDELDAVRYRIREYTANDLGFNIFINGGKLTENFSALNLINDLRSAHVTVLPSTGDEGSDKGGMSDLVTTFTNNAMAAINQYLILKQDIEREMRAIVNITDASLGQEKYLGKSVQERSLMQSDLSTIPFYSSLMEYYRRVIQYAANKNKMILLDNENKDGVILPISEREVKLLKLTKDFTYEDLQVYLNADDTMKDAELGMLNQLLLSYNQNPTIENAEAILNSLQIMRSKSYGEGQTILVDYLEKKKVEVAEAQKQQAQMEQQAQSNQVLGQQIITGQQQMANLLTELTKIQAKGSIDLKKEQIAHGYETDSKLTDALLDQTTALVSQNLSQTQQNASQQ